MGHEVIIHGIIEGALQTSACADLVESNTKAIFDLPGEDQWPWLTKSMFSLPGPGPQGTYRTTVIHFGLSLKDEPPSPSAKTPEDRRWPASERPAIYQWLGKFEALLKRLYWYGADVYITTDFDPAIHVIYEPRSEAIDLMHATPPSPIQSWERKIHFGEA